MHDETFVWAFSLLLNSLLHLLLRHPDASLPPKKSYYADRSGRRKIDAVMWEEEDRRILSSRQSKDSFLLLLVFSS